MADSSRTPPLDAVALRGIRVGAFLGRGGFGDVYRATDSDGSPIALKVVRLTGLASAAAAQKEIKALQQVMKLSHPHLLPMLDVWVHGDCLLIAMPLADGTLDHRLTEAKATGRAGIPVDELLPLLRQAAAALDFLNGHGIQHRDIKPSNLLLQGKSLLVADFDLVKVLTHTQTSHSGAMTFAYAAPEWFGGKMSRYGDQYSLAVSYCKLRGGRLPFDGTNEQLAQGHLYGTPDLSMLPAEERVAVARALAKNPERRWTDCATFVRFLESSPSRIVHVNRLGMEFVRVPRGVFWAGGGKGTPGGTRLTLAADFFLGTCPVTQRQWRTLMRDDPSHFSRGGDGGRAVADVSDADLDQFPVESVSWDDVQRFLTKLNARENDPTYRYRLPTEAEWEYACRGGATSQAECAFDFYVGAPTTVLTRRLANYDGSRPTPVGTFEPNVLGLYDLHGNVFEWCNDGFQDGAKRALRGGSYTSGAESCRAAARLAKPPSTRAGGVGFRVARVLSG